MWLGMFEGCPWAWSVSGGHCVSCCVCVMGLCVCVCVLVRVSAKGLHFYHTPSPRRPRV